jgi:hypothetical protein
MRKIALILSLFFIFLIPWEGVVRLPGLGNMSRLVGLGVGAFWLATVVLTGRFRRPSPFQIAVFVFVLWNALSVFWTGSPSETRGQVKTWAQLFIFVYFLWDLYTTRTAILAGLQAYVLGAYVAFGSAVNNYFSNQAFYTHYDRFSAGDTNPDGFGFILVLGIPAAWYLAVLKSTRTLRVARQRCAPLRLR